jgi:hypothetical protein
MVAACGRAGPPAAPGGFPSGDGSAGGDFRFAFNVLPGDVTRDGAVLAEDYASVRKRFFTTSASPGTGDAAYSAFHDIDGDGQVLAADYAEVKRRFFTRVAAAAPAPAFARYRTPARVAPPPRRAFGG